MVTDPVIVVGGLGKRYSIGGQEAQRGLLRRTATLAVNLLRGRGEHESAASYHWALKDVSFTVEHGERIGIIGRNGAGKSTLLKIMSRVTYPTTGEVRVRGTLTSLLEVGTGFNDNLSGRENVFLNASLYGLTHEQIEARFEDIVAFSEIARFIDTPVKHYSSGMKMRLAFSVAAHLEPDILLLDEVLAVGDMSFQRKCLARVDELTSGGRTLFFVSHGMDSITRYCDRCIWLDSGSVRMDGDVQEVISAYVEAVLNVKAHHSSKLHLKEEGDERVQQAAEMVGIEGNAAADFLEALVLDEQGSMANSVSVKRGIGIRFVYQVNECGLYVPSIALYSPEGTLIFWSVPPEQDFTLYTLKSGIHESTAWIPKKLLNIGVYTVTVALVDPSTAPMRRYFQKEQVVSFHTFDETDVNESATGILPRKFPGPLRPLMNWDTNIRSNAEDTEEMEDLRRNAQLGDGLPRFIVDKKVQVSIDTSGYCNARCESCAWPFMEQSDIVLSLDDFKLILGRFSGYQFSEFAFNSINEPFTDKTILEKIEYFIESGINTEVLFFSSNWLIPERSKIQKFAALVRTAISKSSIGKVRVCATFSGVDQSSYDILQGGEKVSGANRAYKKLDFERAKENIVQLALAFETTIPRKANVVLHIKAYGDLFSEEVYQEYWRTELSKAGVDGKFISEKVSANLNHGFTTFARSELPVNSSLGARHCGVKWLEEKLVVGPDCRVGLCCHEGARKMDLGSLKKLSLMDIVSGKSFSDQLAIVRGHVSPPSDFICNKCEFFVSCK